jgi:hypothetical protein
MGPGGPRLGWLASLAGLFAVAVPSRAEPPSTAPFAAGPAPAALQSQEPAPEPRPAPAVRLAIDVPTTRGPWTMRLTNEGDVPLRVVADARLLVLDVQPRGERSPTRCELPADMRPETDLGRTLIVPPSRSYSESFEPRLYCFGPAKVDALSPQAVVVAHLGWLSGRKTDPPFEVSPIDGFEPAVMPLKAVDAPPVGLPDEPSAWIAAAVAPDPPSADVPRLSLEGSSAVDAEMTSDISIPVTLRNEGTRAVVVRFRPELLSFDLIGPAGVEHCQWPVTPGAAVREAFSLVPAQGSEVLSVTLDSYCTAHGLDQSGLLVVRPRFDGGRSGGASLGLHAFEGQLIASTPTVVRLHRGVVARSSPSDARPRLDP